jgi:hypothetical protein
MPDDEVAMSVFLLVNIQTAYAMAALIVLMGAGTVFFLRTLDDHSTRLLTRLSLALAITSAFIFGASLKMLEETLALGLLIANFGIVFGVIAVAEVTRRLLGLKKRTRLAATLVALAFLLFEYFFDPSRPLMCNAIRHGFEAVVGLALAVRLSKIPITGTPILKRLLAATAALYSAEAMFELYSVLSKDMLIKTQGTGLVLGLGDTVGIAGTSMLTGLFVALLMRLTFHG